MDYNRPWHEMTIDVKGAIRKEIVLEDMLKDSEYVDKPVAVWHFGADSVDKFLSPDWIEKMHKIGIPVRTAMIFYRVPSYVHPDAHIDIMAGSDAPAVSAINWTIDAQDDSDMVWYKIPSIPPIDSITPAGTKYRHWPVQQIRPYESARKIIGIVPTLVRTGIPHNVETRTRARWCISLRYKSVEFESWESTVNYFKPWIKNADS
jgi:hypothetical protein